MSGARFNSIQMPIQKALIGLLAFSLLLIHCNDNPFSSETRSIEEAEYVITNQAELKAFEKRCGAVCRLEGSLFIIDSDVTDLILLHGLKSISGRFIISRNAGLPR
ncbi:MAG: hypothetical protein GKR89_11830 [Candidatus Latescibacteria bacterium]|nr:hypothetical protein [Candidatus Latescibacterota bacterium]